MHKTKQNSTRKATDAIFIVSYNFYYQYIKDPKLHTLRPK